MKNNKKLLSKFLTVILSTMMIFSSVLVVKSNIVLAETNDKEQSEIIEEPETENKQNNINDGESIAPNQDSVTPPQGDETGNSDGTTDPEIIPTPENTENNGDGETSAPPVRAPLKSSGPFGTSIIESLFGRNKNTYTVTFIVDNKEYTPTNDFNYKKVAKGSIPKPSTPIKEGYLFKGWFIRIKDDLLGLIKSEVLFNFNNDDVTGETEVNKNITLYAKFEKETKADLYYNFRVKHLDSYQKSIEQFLAEGKSTGEVVMKDGDYIYSYYSYYKQSEYQTVLRDFSDIIKGTKNFDKTWVIDYDYQMYDDQFIYTVVNDVSEIDSQGKGKVTNFADSNYIGKSYTVIGEDILYGSNGQVVNEHGKLVKIGDYYIGNAFDLAIQDANRGDVIELLDNLYVTKPIEIWADVNLDLNKRTVVYDENSDYLDWIHFVDRHTRSSDIIVPDYIAATILVTNANTTISNGVIRNTHSKGTGIVDISFDEDYKLTLQDVEVIVDGPSNTSKYAIQAGYNKISESSVIVNQSSGYIDVISGKYHGYFVNNNNGRLTLYNGVRSEYDPRYLQGTTTSSGVTCEDYAQVWNDGTKQYPWIVDVQPEVAIVDDYGTTIKEYRTLLEAVNAATTGSNIMLLKNIDLNKASYVSNGTINLNNPAEYSIWLNEKVITGSEIDITKGKVKFDDSYGGYVKSKIRVKDEGSLLIDGGNYYSIYDDTVDTLSNPKIEILSGNFIDNIPERFYDSTHECLFNDVPTYRYTISLITAKDALTLSYKDSGNNTVTKDYKTFSNIINAINSSNGSNYEITLNKDIQINGTITINKPLTLDLGNHKITSRVDYKASDSSDLTSIFIELEGTKDKVIIKNGTLLNTSIGTDGVDVYGIYVEEGSLELNNLSMRIRPTECSTAFGIYNDSKTNDVNIVSTIIYVIDEFEAFSFVQGVHNNGNLTVKGSYIVVSNLCNDITGIYNTGKLKFVDSQLSASASSTKKTNVYAINSSNDVHIYNEEGFNLGNKLDKTKIIANTINGAAYGVYQRYLENGVHTIKVEKDVEFNVTADNGVANGTEVYGIYTASANHDKNNHTDVLLGKCYFYISSPHNKAVGVYAEGGYVYAGTVNSGELNTYGMFDVVNSNNTASNVHDDIYADGFDRFAIFKIVGTNTSAGIDIEYGKKANTVSQLTNTIIIMDCSGDNTYCVKASNSIIGVDIISGYYDSKVNNRMMNEKRVFCKGGYFNSDVSLNASKNKKCVRTTAQDTKRHCSYDNKDYKYTIDGSNCTLTVSANTTDQIALKIMIGYDPVMLNDPNHYGIKITVDDFVDGQPYSIVMTIAAYNQKYNVQNGKYVYDFPLPIKMMNNNIQVEIVSFDDNGEVTHTYHLKSTFSIRQYFYQLLDDKNERSEEIRDLAVASLNMGAAAQQYFDYYVNDDKYDLVNNEVSDYYNESDGVLYDQKVVHNDNIGTTVWANRNDIENAVEYIGHSLELEGKTSLRFYFTPKIGNISNYEFTSKHYDKDGNVIDTIEGLNIVKRANDYYIDIPKIGILDIVDKYEIVLTISGQTYSFIYSPIDYIYYTTVCDLASDALLKQLMNAYYEVYEMSKLFDFSRSN